MSIWRDGPWPLGAFQSGEVENIPEGGLARLYDGVWDDQGVPYRRGGSVYKSGSALSPAPRWIADRRLVGGQRTAFANTAELSSLDSNDSSLFTVSTEDPVTTIAPVVVKGRLFWAIVSATPTYSVRVWGGSRKADYNTGTVTVTDGSKTVTGSGTSWSANVERGALLRTTSTVFGDGVVDTVDSNTQVTLVEPWSAGTASGEIYTLSPTLSTRGSGYEGTAITALGSVANRLLVARGTWMGFSPTDNALASIAGDDFHTLPAPVLGIGNIRDTAIVFTTEGTYAIYNMALDLTNADGSPQQRVERLSDELILWGQHGIVGWGNGLIAPMIDGIWYLDASGDHRKLSGPIEDNYLSRVRDGYTVGGAALFNGRYVLPIRANDFAASQDLLTCRLTPNAQGRSLLWSWHRGHGGGGGVRAVATRAPTSAGAAPLLLATGDDGKISTLRHFEPAAAYKSDGDATAHVLEIQTRAYETGRNRRNYVDTVTVHYLLVDAASDNPTVDLAYALDGAASFTAVSGTGAESSGTVAKRTWKVGRAARTIQFRLRTGGAAASAKFLSIEVKTRDSARP